MFDVEKTTARGRGMGIEFDGRKGGSPTPGSEWARICFFFGVAMFDVHIVW